jgi:hypothetical protein
VKALVLAGNSPVILDGNFVMYRQRLEWTSGDLWTTLFRVFPTPPEECKRRALLNHRHDLVDDIIDRMARNWDVILQDGEACYPTELVNWKP